MGDEENIESKQTEPQVEEPAVDAKEERTPEVDQPAANEVKQDEHVTIKENVVEIKDLSDDLHSDESKEPVKAPDEESISSKKEDDIIQTADVKEEKDEKQYDVSRESFKSLDRKTDESLVKEAKETKKPRTERLSSIAKKVVGSTISIRRMSAFGELYDKKGARFMNTYKLDSDNPFNPDKVHRILESVMIEALENLTYDPDKCPKQAKWASSAIRTKVKELQFDRYKLICLVTIGEKTSQDVLVTCRFLWDVERDRYATYSLENTYVYGIAQCFGVYYE